MHSHNPSEGALELPPIAPNWSSGDTQCPAIDSRGLIYLECEAGRERKVLSEALPLINKGKKNTV